jgi:hypothetical protein
MLTDTAFNGLNSALQEEPSLVLSFYSYGVLMRKRDGDITSEYAVNPQDIALALNASMRLNTGILHPDTLFISTNGVEKTVVQYRKAQMTGIYLDGAETALTYSFTCFAPHTPNRHEPKAQLPTLCCEETPL